MKSELMKPKSHMTLYSVISGESRNPEGKGQNYKKPRVMIFICKIEALLSCSMMRRGALIPWTLPGYSMIITELGLY